MHMKTVTCVRVSFQIKFRLRPVTLFKKEALTPVFSCKFCEIFKEHLWATASKYSTIRADQEVCLSKLFVFDSLTHSDCFPFAILLKI